MMKGVIWKSRSPGRTIVGAYRATYGNQTRRTFCSWCGGVLGASLRNAENHYAEYHPGLVAFLNFMGYRTNFIGWIYDTSVPRYADAKLLVKDKDGNATKAG